MTSMRLLDRLSSARMDEQRAIIDIGSNTVRLAIYGGPLRAPTVLFNEKVMARLGRGVDETGCLSDRAMAAALAGLGRYAALIKLNGIKQVETVATAAVRDASNGPEFVAAVAGLGLKPRVLTGEEEALTSAFGVLAAFPGAKGVVGDLGGGSLELTDVGDGVCEHGISLPLGSLRLPALRAAGPAKFGRQVQKLLATAKLSNGKGSTLYFVGGPSRAVARYAMQQLKWPVDDTHGFELESATALALFQTLARGEVDPCNASGIASSRVAALPDTAALLYEVAHRLKPTKVVFSSWGLREGLLEARLSQETRSQDPLIAAVAAFAGTKGVSTPTAAIISGWTARVNPADGAGREQLRLAACLLALASLRIEPNLRRGHVADWALRKRWVGIDAEGRAMLAMACLANTGRTTPPDSLTRIASPALLREAAGWGLAIRLCRKFSGGSAQSISNAALTREEGRLVLTVREPWDVLCTETVEKALRGLASWLGLAPVLERLPAEAELA